MKTEIKIERVNSKGNSTNFRFLSFAIILFIIHYLCNSIAGILGYLEPNIVLYEPSYLSDFVNNFLYPWIVLTHQPYAIFSLILGVIAILTEIAALGLLFFKLPKTLFPEEKKYLYPTIRIAFLINSLAKYLVLYLTSYVLIERNYDYPDKIFWSFYSGNGFALFFSFFLFFFIVQATLLTELVYLAFKELNQEKPSLSPTTISSILPLFLIPFLFKILNVAPPLDLNPNYLSALTTYLISNALLFVGFLIYFISILLLTKLITRK